MVSAQVVPEGFRVELLYEAPEIEHPSVVTCDDRGNLFVGEDPMDMRGPTTEEFDRVLFIQFDENGAPFKKTVFCDGLSAVFGLVWLDGWLYVMHAPHYSRFKDLDGDGVADLRQDLAIGFGPPAGIYGFNDHIVTGTRLGLDGWIYVSVGDKGIQRATGADGSTITLEGGGVVRMRPDGTQLEVVSSGTRNHLDVAMDSLDNMFTYDNTDDGLGWWTRFTHHIPTGYYGYPYDYHPHPERHLPHISETGGGSAVGAAFYRQAAWPERYRDTAFHCEWGKRKIQRFTVRKQGATFAAEMEDFMTAAEGSEFRPLDVCFSPDGRYMYVADWNFGGWTKPDVVGRLYRVSYVGDDVEAEPTRADNADSTQLQLAALSHPAHSERMRAQHELVRRGLETVGGLRALLMSSNDKYAKVHAIWTLNALADRYDHFDPVALWISACHDEDPDVRAQAARAIGTRRSPAAAGELVTLLRDEDAAVRMWAAIGLGRIGDTRTARALWELLGEPDEFARFAVVQALRAMNDWRLAPEYLRSEDEAIARHTLLALTTVYESAAVAALTGLVSDAQGSNKPVAIAALAEVCRQSDPYTEGWWGTQPARGKPARAKIHDWESTSLILATLRDALHQNSAEVRIAAIQAVRDLRDEPSLPSMRALLDDAEEPVQLAAAAALADFKDDDSVERLAAMAGDVAHSEALRRQAIEAITRIGSAVALEQFLNMIADEATSAELTVAVLSALRELEATSAADAVRQCLAAESPDVRAQAIATLVALDAPAAAESVALGLDDQEVSVRRAALEALGQLRVAEYLPRVLELAADAELRYQAIATAASMPDRRGLALYLDGIVDRSSELRDRCRQAVVALGSDIDGDLAALHERGEMSEAVRAALQQVLALPRPMMSWQIAGAWPKGEQPEIDPSAAPDTSVKLESAGIEHRWRQLAASDERGRMRLDAVLRPRDNCWAVAYAEIESDQESVRQLLIGSDDQIVVWVNGERVHEYQGSRAWSPDHARVEARLHEGVNHVWVLTGNDGGPWDFSVAIEQPRQSLSFLHDAALPAVDASAYREFAMNERGDAVRGRELFEDRQGVACVKCHAVGGSGGQVGPDLASIGARYPREELIRSVLEPSNRILTGYQLTIVVTDAGEVLQGIVRSETDDEIELVDAEARVRRIKQDEIDEREESNLSMMPIGLKDGLSLQELADLIAYLESLQQAPGAESQE